MSRAYRISVKESLAREVKGSDEIRTRLELLDILPPEPTAALLRQELKSRGFGESADGTLSRTQGGTTVTVDPCSGEVAVTSEVAENVSLEARRESITYDDIGPDESTVRERVKADLRADLERKADREAQRLQAKATQELEKKLEELQPELGQVVNKVTRESLKRKAAQMGTVTEVAEDEQTGNMTIKIEV